MGRPPIGQTAMTATEHQRRWRQRKRTQPATAPPREPDTRAAEPDTRPEPPEHAPAPAHSTAERLIEQLTQERDQARRERDLALQGSKPRAAGDNEGNWCFVCHKRREDVAIMLTAARNYFQLFICDRCVDDMSRIVAEKRQHKIE
jgi:hypothetical protein